MGEIGIHLDYQIIFLIECALESISISTAQAALPCSSNHAIVLKCRTRGEQALTQIGRSIRGIVIHHHHVRFWGDPYDLLHKQRNILRLVICWNYDEDLH